MGHLKPAYLYSILIPFILFELWVHAMISRHLRLGHDVPMFRRSGLSIAMGNASDEVKAEAGVTTASNDMDGFAQAMERFILHQ